MPGEVQKSFEMETVKGLQERTPWLGFGVENYELQIDYCFDKVEELEIKKWYAENKSTPIISITARRGEDVCKIDIGFECAQKLEEFILTENLIDSRLYELVKEYCKIAGWDINEFIRYAIVQILYANFDLLREADIKMADELIARLKEIEKEL